VIALLLPPLLKRPFPTRAGIALVPAIIVGTLVLAKLISAQQRTIVWLGMGALVGHALLMVISREPRDPEKQATWAECFAGAVGVFALFTLGYAILPHEWLTFANADLEWGEATKFVWKSNQPILGLDFLPNYPFNFDFPAVRDIVVTGIYVVFLGANLKLWVMWQKRHEVKPAPAEGEEGAVVKRSRFGRPLRAKA
jgi:hypothetical protein